MAAAGFMAAAAAPGTGTGTVTGTGTGTRAGTGTAAFAENRTANPAFAAFAAPCKSRVFPSRRGPYGPVSAGFSTPGPGVWGADGWGKRRGFSRRMPGPGRGRFAAAFPRIFYDALPGKPAPKGRSAGPGPAAPKATRPRMNTGFSSIHAGFFQVAPAGVEPAMGESKSPALPLGDGALHPAQWLTLAGRKAFLPGQKELSFQLRQRILLPR